MPRQKKNQVEGELSDGSFDISDVPDSPEDLEGAIADAFGGEADPGAPRPDTDEPASPDDFDVVDEMAAGGTAPGGGAGVRPGPGAGGDADEEVARLIHERDEAVEARKRAMADFVNFRRRADENEVRARQDGVASVVRSLMPMLDQFDLALGQTDSGMTTEQLLEGVRMVRNELSRALEGHAVRMIDPEIGAEFDPNEHQAVTRAVTDEQPPNTIAAVLQVGYAVNEMVLRPASVSVAAGTDDAGG